ncbi:MAG: peptidylprolyl isomerase [Thermoleophilia bacterium]|jgi:foldase protein PrsA
MRNRVLALALLLVLVLAFAAACGGSSVPTGAIAKVGDGVVTKAQFDSVITQAKAQAVTAKSTFPALGTAQYDTFAAKVVDYLVQLELITQQAQKMGITVTDAQVTTQIAAIDKAYGGATKVAAILKQQGMTQADLRSQVKAQLLGQGVQQKVYKGITVTDQQAKAYFATNKSQFDVPASRVTRHVLVSTLAEAQKVRALLVANPSNANWKVVAAKYSIDTGSKNSGGSLGAIQPGQMVAAFSKAAFSLKLDQISQPVKSQFGYHIIQVTKITPATNPTFAKVETAIKQMIVAQQEQKVWTAWLAKVTKDTKIVYAKGYDPAELNKAASTAPSPAPAASSSSSAAPSTGASQSASPSPSPTQ